MPAAILRPKHKQDPQCIARHRIAECLATTIHIRITFMALQECTAGEEATKKNEKSTVSTTGAYQIGSPGRDTNRPILVAAPAAKVVHGPDFVADGHAQIVRYAAVEGSSQQRRGRKDTGAARHIAQSKAGCTEAVQTLRVEVIPATTHSILKKRPIKVKVHAPPCACGGRTKAGVHACPLRSNVPVPPDAGNRTHLVIHLR